MKRHRFGLNALGFAGALLASTVALAGFRSTQEVIIFDNGHFANGDLGYVHNTDDSTQYIGCYSEATFGHCFATNRAGLTRQCSTSDSNLLAVIRSLKSDSWLIFYWDTSGYCTSVEVENSSIQAAKKLRTGSFP